MEIISTPYKKPPRSLTMSRFTFLTVCHIFFGPLPDHCIFAQKEEKKMGTMTAVMSSNKTVKRLATPGSVYKSVTSVGKVISVWGGFIQP